MDKIFTRDFLDEEPELAKRVYATIKDELENGNTRRIQRYVHDTICETLGRYGRYLENPTEEQQQEAKVALFKVRDFLKTFSADIPFKDSYYRAAYIAYAPEFVMPLIAKSYCSACEKLVDYMHFGFSITKPCVMTAVIMAIDKIEEGF